MAFLTPVTDPCLGCNLIESSAVTLLDGKNVCPVCPSWRLECEAREVLSKPPEARKAYLEKVEEKRGKAGCDALKAAISAIWEKR